MSKKKYDDIINMPHHVSSTRPQMSAIARAAQFSPFAALTGHDEAIKETARRTNAKLELSESDRIVLDEKMQMITDRLSSFPEVMITYFVADERKAGGKYTEHRGNIKTVDRIKRCVIFKDGMIINVDDIYDIDADFLND